MTISNIKKISSSESITNNDLVDLELNIQLSILLYPKSIEEYDDAFFLIGKDGNDKNLYLIYKNSVSKVAEEFEGELIDSYNEDTSIKKCALNHNNRISIQKFFDYTKPVVIGLKNSFGFGDRLGLANAAHLRSLDKSDFKPVLAQQSIRELTRTQRTPEEVMDAAVWAVFQEGFKKGFGSDADHLKTPEDIDLMIEAGFTMFTFDPGEHVVNEADHLPVEDLMKICEDFNWIELKDNLDSMIERYDGIKFDLGEGFEITPVREDVLRAITKYGKAVTHIEKMYKYLENNYSHLDYEVEVSVDETESITTPFEHFFMSSELKRLGVKLISLAPRFIGDFEKGIDYKGDLDIFKEEYLKHIKIAEYFGSYKISLHSGSDKFGVYNAIGSLRRGYTHVKTAGTSYLEALRVIAASEPDLMREILDFSRTLYEQEKETYHVSAELSKVKPAADYDNRELLELFEQDDARQVLHVTFGKVLTTIGEEGQYLFRDCILQCLVKNEDLHYKFLYKHFRRHLDPFNGQ